MTEFQRRRTELMRRIGANSIVILPTAREFVRNRDVHHPFRPDSDFYYLSGFAEPEAVLVLAPGRQQGEYALFCREKDPQSEQWEGYRAGLEGVVTDYGADEAFSYAEMDVVMPDLLAQREQVFYPLGCDQAFDQRVIRWLSQVRNQARSGIQAPLSIASLDQHLHEMRLYKTALEVGTLRRAAQISAAAHQAVMQTCKPGQYEYQLAATFQYDCQRQGVQALAYPSIVGGGENACVLHYIDNRDRLGDGDLVLIDAGCELDYYAADITRTFPVNGRFTEAQAQLYELVLAAQQAAIAHVKPGHDWNDPHLAATRVLTEGLLRLGILQGDLDTALAEERYKPYYMHRTGHWLGMDVHDVGAYQMDGDWRPLEAGMVLTVEPGLYMPKDDSKVAEKWRGIGIRIEDDVLVGTNGPEVLSQDVPKSICEIEALMAT